MRSLLYRSTKGQAVIVAAFVIVVFLGLAALTIDLGYVWHAYNELQNSTNAAATAGAQDLPNSTAVTTATAYSGVAGNKNAYKDLPNVQMVSGYPMIRCLNYMVGLGLSCANAANANAIAVQQQVTVSTFFAKVLGIRSITLKASALAAMRGGNPIPANITLIMDTTHSMQDSDSDPACATATGLSNPTKEDCAKWGVRVFLQSLYPCSPGLSSCGTVTNGNVPNAIQEVGLLTFPGLGASSDASADYTSCGSNFKSSYVSLYGVPGSSPPYFTIVPPSSNYRTSDSSGLNGSSSNMVQAVDWADGVGCTSSQYGLQDPGGAGTYYAGIITEAMSDLSAITAPRNVMQNVLILFSDGNANAGKSDFLSGTSSTYYTNDCQQAVTAAQTAANTKNAAGLATWVYSLAFGSSTSGTCTTDTGAYANNACLAMQNIASDPTKFYSDDANGCASTSHPTTTSWGAIFQNIANDFSSTRLLPFNTN